jgi:hypothetical protein
LGLDTPITARSPGADPAESRVGDRGPLPDVPVLRTLRSRRFRLATAVLLIALGIATHVVFFSIALSDGGADAGDLDAYRMAALRLAEGEPLYSVEQLSEAIDATAVWAYLYPPLLAQALVPFSGVPEPVLSAAWYALQFAAMYAAVWLAGGLGGAGRSVERALWTLAAVLLFMPVVSSTWFGNVSGFMALGALLVAYGGATAGLATALMILVKVSPVAYVPAVAMMGRRALVALLAGLLVLGGLGFVLAPEAWLDYPAVLSNLLAGSTDYGYNLAPATIADRAGVPQVGVTLIRLAALATAGASILVSAWLARRADGRPAAALLATAAMLLGPATLWYHYLVVLLPFAAMAWPRSMPSVRLGLLAAAAAVSLGMASAPLAFLGAVALVCLALPALWPSGERLLTEPARA